MSEVDICNLALANLGDTAEISSLSESSTQAQLCKRFYPIARDALLEMSAWGFSTRRALLAEVANLSTQWMHTYSLPPGVLNVLAVLPSDAPGDIEVNYTGTMDCPWPSQWPAGYVPAPGAVVYTPQPYTLEIDAKGNSVLLTNQPNALLRYTAKVTDTTKFSPLFTMALGWLLSSHLAGPILKGDAGAAETKRCLQVFQNIEAQAEVSDANQVDSRPQVAVPWIVGR